MKVEVKEAQSNEVKKKTSSVEWLVEQLKNRCDTAKSIRENIQQAKEMHREEMEEAFNESRKTHPMIGFKHETFEQYYNETYGSTKQD